MFFGVERTERILGLHRKACHGCSPASERLVTRRRWAYNVLGVPLLALDARWRRCTGCRRRAAMPRLSLPTTVTATFVLAFLLGLDVIAYGDLFVWVLLMAFWGVWLTGHLVDTFLDRTLIPVPAALYRPIRARPTPATRPGAVRRLARYTRMARTPLRLARRLRRRSRAATTSRPTTPS